LIVLDASALVELVLGTPRGRAVASRIGDPEVSLNVPHLADVEVAQVLRRYVREGGLEEAAGRAGLEILSLLDLERHAHEPLLERVWALRSNLTAYDAVYVALAEALGGRLLTCDSRLARAPGLRGRVDLVT
jgi:predicted nucleic acid-binding protein